ncbi:MAG: cupin domain-containing protein [Planctomycetota bacterium]|jgi:quercetin dioxygenase-like cupin family protein
MGTNEAENTLLNSCLSSPQDLGKLVEYAQDAIVSKTILAKPIGTISLFAFDRGQTLSEHTSPYDAVVQVLDGKAMLTIGGNAIEVLAGQLIIMPANVPHAVNAEEKFKMLLTMIRK